MEKDAMDAESSLWVIDLQERFLPAIESTAMERALDSTVTLVRLASEVGARIIYTEQYPSGLGPTVERLRVVLEEADAQRFEKMTFDACLAPSLGEELSATKSRVFVCGIEAHICVRATVCSLCDRGVGVRVPFDAVASRRAEYSANGIQRMRDAGARITNRESIVFDSLETAEHPAFKTFSKMIR